MKSSQTFSILIWANRAKASWDGLIPLYARVTINGKRAEISLKKKVEAAKWNPSAGSMRGNSEEARTINYYLNQIKSQLFKLYSQLLLNDKMVSAETVKLHFTGEKADRKSLLDIFDYHNQQMETIVGIDVVKATYSRFKTTRNRVADFVRYQYQKSDMFLDEITYQFVASFEYYLKTQKHIDHNTTMKYVRNVKKILSMAVSHGWLLINPLQSFKCTYRKVERDILTQAELQLISDKQLPIKRMEEVRDVFLFCCYTGLSFVDVQKLSHSHLTMGIDREKWLQIRRTKTNIRSNIPLLPQALDMIEKYKNHPECELKDRLLPVKSNQKMNAYLKELADVFGIHKKLTMHIELATINWTKS